MHTQSPLGILSVGSLCFDPSLKMKKVAIPHFTGSLHHTWEFQSGSTDLLDSSWQQIFMPSVHSHGTLGNSSGTADWWESLVLHPPLMAAAISSTFWAVFNF